MKKLSIAKIIDQYGWSYFFIAKEMAVYSKHNVTFQKYSDFNYSASDIILISSPNIAGDISCVDIPKKCKAEGKIVIGQYSGETSILYQNVDLIVTISPSLYWSAKERYKTTPVIFLPEAVDTNYFTASTKLPKSPLVIGWAGGPNKDIKRHQLLDYLKRCKIMKQMNHGVTYFTKDRTLDEMREFYRKIDIFVLPSLTECMPRVIMEAMATGKTCFATDVGSNSILLSSQNLISVYPDSQVLKELQYKIDNVQFNGKRNREWIETYFSWSAVMPIWDRVFEALMNKDYNSIQKISNSYLTQWAIQFKDSRTKINLTKALGYNYVHELYKLGIPTSVNLQSDKSSIKNTTLENKLQTLQSANVKFWGLQKTCLYMVNGCNKCPDIIAIGVKTEEDKQKILSVMSAGVDITVNPRQQIKVWKDNIYVPLPVVPYLINMFGDKWNTLTT